MSSCQSKSNGELPKEKAEKLRQERYEFVRGDFRKIVMQASLQYMASPDFLPDFAFNVDRKGAIIAALEDVIKELKESP